MRIERMEKMHGVYWVDRQEVQKGIDSGDLLGPRRITQIKKRDGFFRSADELCWLEAASIAKSHQHDVIYSRTTYVGREATSVCKFYDLSPDGEIRLARTAIDNIISRAIPQ